MLDEDLSCDSCLKEAIARRFLYYPNHDAVRITKIRQENDHYNCTICGGKGVLFSVSIIMQSLNKDRLLREREMIKEAERNAKKK